MFLVRLLFFLWLNRLDIIAVFMYLVVLSISKLQSNWNFYELTETPVTSDSGVWWHKHTQPELNCTYKLP